MNGSGAISRIQRRLGFRGANFKSADILEELNDAQDLLQRRKTLPWFLLEEEQTITSTANVPTISLPTGFIFEAQDAGWRYQVVPTDISADSLFLQKVPFDEGFRRHSVQSEQDALQDSDNDSPTMYALRKEDIYLFPTPTEAITFVGSYYKFDDAITADAENRWLANFPLLLVGHAGFNMAMALRDKEAIQIFDTMIKVWEDALSAAIADRELANRPIQMGRNNL